MISFKEWVRQKTEGTSVEDQARRVREWIDACERLAERVVSWLSEEGEGRVTIGRQGSGRNEAGLGYYTVSIVTIRVGDDNVTVIPIGRNVIGSFGLRNEPEYRGAGRVDLTDGLRKYSLYRTIQNNDDVWYVVDERSDVSLLTKDRFLEIVMDLMS